MDNIIVNKQEGEHNEINLTLNTYNFSDESNVDIPRFITNMPIIDKFEGRGKEKIQVCHLLKKNQKLISISGIRGVGKTALAKSIMLDAVNNNEYDHLIYLEIKSDIKEAFANDANLIANLKLTSQVKSIPHATTSKNDIVFEIIINRLLNISSNSLLVIDNSTESSLQHIEKLNNLPWQKLISTREKISQSIDFPLIQAKDEDAVKIFSIYYSNKNFTAQENILLSNITKRLGSHCLAMELVAKNAKELDWKIERIEQELNDKGLQIRNYSEGVTVQHSNDQEVKNMFDYLLQLFNPFNESYENQLILLYFSVCPSIWTNKVQWSSLCNQNIDDIAESLNILHRRAWLFKEVTKQSNGDEQIQYSMHQLLAEILREKFKILPIWEETNKLLERLKLITSHKLGYFNNHDKIESFIQISHEIIKHIFTSFAIKLSENLSIYLYSIGNLSLSLSFAEQMNKISEAIVDPYGLVYSYGQLGTVHISLNNLKQALELFELKIKLLIGFHEKYPDDLLLKDDLAISYSKLGDIQLKLNNLHRAIQCYSKYNNLKMQLYEADTSSVRQGNGLAISYEKIGDVHLKLENIPKALEFYLKNNQIVKSLYHIYQNDVDCRKNIAISLSRLGDCYLRLDDLPKALDFFTTSDEILLSLQEEFPSNVNFKNGLAISCEKLSNLCQKMGNQEQSKQYFEKAKKLWEELVKQAPMYVEYQQSLERIKQYLVN